MCILLVSCTKDEDRIYTESPDERIAELLARYDKILVAEENGWVLSLETVALGGFNHWVKFYPNNRVDMLSDADATSSKFANSSSEIKQSSYRLKSVQTPILMFDTYSYIHMLADPTGSVNGGTNGDGLITDFEFAISAYNEEDNSFELTGRYNGSRAKLVTCSKSQYDYIIAGGLKAEHDAFNGFVDDNYKFPVIDMGDKKVDMTLSSRMVGIKYINDENAIEEASAATYLDMSCARGEQAVSNAILVDPLSYAGGFFDKILYEDGSMYVLINGTKYYIIENNKPALPFRFGYKEDFTQMRINADQLEGTLVDPYLTNVYMKAKNALYNKGSKRNMQYVNIEFDMSSAGTPVMTLGIRYNNTSGSNYWAYWDFKYTLNDDGTITFTDRDQNSTNGNPKSREPNFVSILDYFCELEYSKYSTSAAWSSNKEKVTKITPKTFRMDWANNNTPGLSASIGGFIPVDAEQLEAEGICCGVVSQ